LKFVEIPVIYIDCVEFCTEKLLSIQMSLELNILIKEKIYAKLNFQTAKNLAFFKERLRLLQTW